MIRRAEGDLEGACGDRLGRISADQGGLVDEGAVWIYHEPDVLNGPAGEAAGEAEREPLALLQCGPGGAHAADKRGGA